MARNWDNDTDYSPENCLIMERKVIRGWIWILKSSLILRYMGKYDIKRMRKVKIFLRDQPLKDGNTSFAEDI